jgi:hypothetical protein
MLFIFIFILYYITTTTTTTNTQGICTLQTHKKELRIQQHLASAFTAAIKNATWTGQPQAGKT